MMSDIHIAKGVLPLKTIDDAKDRILNSAKTSVKQIQSYFSICKPENSLSLDLEELHQLCDSLDKTLFYGLRECQQGYWPFVKEFTHRNTAKFLQTLANAPSDLQKGRAWLSLALNENSLESYFRSFRENANVIRKHYLPVAIVLDDQRMQLLLMLIAGLENVPFSLDVERIPFGTGLSFMDKTLSITRSFSNCSSNLSQYGNTQTSSQSSSQDTDAGIGEYDDSDGTDEYRNQTSSTKTSPGDQVESDGHCRLSTQELERITKYINMTAEDGGVVVPENDLEVIRTKVVRRTKKSPMHGRNSQSRGEDKENRLSKITTDSGVSELESQCSSGRNSPETKKDTSFNIGNIQPQLDVVFSTPVRRDIDCNNDILKQALLMTEERGVPEGQEDPSPRHCANSGTPRLPLLPGNDGQDEEENEISFYDLCKDHYLAQNVTLELSENFDSPQIEDNISDGTTMDHDLTSDSSDNMNPKIVDPVAEELALLSNCLPEENLNFRVNNDTLLYLLVEIYECNDEEFFKMFYGYSDMVKANGQMSLFLLTNRSVYLLNPGSNEPKFVCLASVKYSDIDLITVILNYQGFTILGKNKSRVTLYTADENLTRSILSNLELVVRRSSPKVPIPAVATDAISQIRILSNYLATELKCLPSEISLHHFVLARWEDYDGGLSPSTTPAGPKQEGFLTYRRIRKRDSSDEPWLPGYFILNGGVLYCMDEENKAAPLFFIHISVPNCKGCRRLSLPKRPYAFEVILPDDERLQLTATDEYEASHWQNSFLQVILLAGHLVDTEVSKITTCSVILCNESIVIAKEFTSKSLCKANLCDLNEVFSDPSVGNSVLLEFEIADASKSCGEWIFVFDSEIEKDKFLDVLMSVWYRIFQVQLMVSPVKDLSLMKRLRLLSEDINSQRRFLQQLCAADP